MEIAVPNPAAPHPVTTRSRQAGFFSAGLGLALVALFGGAIAGLAPRDQPGQEPGAQVEQFEATDTEIHVDP
jgi:hypothetical protein